jgi:hypothetical protein
MIPPTPGVLKSSPRFRQSQWRECHPHAYVVRETALVVQQCVVLIGFAAMVQSAFPHLAIPPCLPQTKGRFVSRRTVRGKLS